MSPFPTSEEPNPYAPSSDWRPGQDTFTAQAAGIWAEGFAAGRAAFDAVVAERDEMIRVSAANIAATQRNMDALVAERDAAITAGQKLADLVTLLGGYDGPGYLAAPNQGERPDYVAAARLFSKIMRDETNGAAAALAAWRAVSGSSEPR